MSTTETEAHEQDHSDKEPALYTYPGPNRLKDPNKRNKGFVVIAGVAIAAVAGGALSAAVAFGPKRDNAPKPQPTATTEVLPSAQPTAVETAPGSERTFVGEVLLQTKTIEEMDNITNIETFAQLPYADRLAYAYEKLPQMSIDKAEDGNTRAFDDPTMIAPYYTQTLNSMSLNNEDTLLGAKEISANYLYTTENGGNNISPAFQGVAENIIQGGGKGMSNTAALLTESTGQWQTGVDRDGNPIDFVNVTLHSVDVTNTQIDETITTQLIRQEVKLLNGSTIIFYPMGFGISGKKSPIEGGTY